jgi:hypothetical protein
VLTTRAAVGRVAYDSLCFYFPLAGPSLLGGGGGRKNYLTGARTCYRVILGM